MVEQLMWKIVGKVVVSISLVMTLPIVLTAQKTATGPDLLILTSAERLTGHLQDAANGKVDFNSDGLGKISVDWAKVQELHSTGRFAVIEKNVKLKRTAVINGIPQGTIAVASQRIEVTPQGGGPSQTILVSNVAFLVEQQTFLNAVQHDPGLLHDWQGAASFGAALVEATQNSVSLSSSLSLVRGIPSQAWLTPRNRTSADFSSAYGSISQPAMPIVKTSIFHADAARDEYFTEKIYALANTAFDHSFSQGLALQQIYGGGIGWTVIKNTNQTLDLEGSVTYERQSFFVAGDPTRTSSVRSFQKLSIKNLQVASQSRKSFLPVPHGIERAHILPMAVW